MRSPLVLITVCAVLIASAARPLDGQIVRGQVVDSVTSRPVPGSVVLLLDVFGNDVARTVADAEGLFLINPPGAAEYRLRVESEGYRSSTFPPFVAKTNEVHGFMLLVASLTPAPDTPTVAEVISELCAERTVEPGQGVLVGFVRNAETQAPVADARVSGSWSALNGALASMLAAGDRPKAGGAVASDSAGVYVACGVPGRTRIVLHAALGDLLSDFVEVRFDSGGVFIDGAFNSTEQSLWRLDFALASAEQRTGVVTGTVLDAATLHPLEGATVEVPETGLQATTGSAGSFRLAQLPAGPVTLSVRQPGFRPMSYEVVLSHRDTVTLATETFALETLPTELDPVVVEAERTSTRRPLTEFWERREAGGGSFITRQEFEKQGNPQKPTDVLRRMRGIRVRGNSNYGKPLANVDPERGWGLDQRRFVIETRRGLTRTFGGRGSVECPPLIYLDRMYLGDALTVVIDDILPLIDVEAIEAYSSAATLPPQLNRTGSTCGVIVFWTR